MSKMPCPSDFRFGDSSDPRSPDFEGQEPVYISVHHDFYDEDGNSKRADISVQYYAESDGDDDIRVADASIVDIVLSGSTISKKDALEAYGDLPDDSELADLVEKARSYEKRCMIDLAGRNAVDKAEYAKIQVAYQACPPDPARDGDSRVDIRSIEIGKEVEIAKFKFVPLNEFIKSHPGLVLPTNDDLKVLVESAHLEKFGKLDAPQKRNVFRP